jgi:hypothetical protein
MTWLLNAFSLNMLRDPSGTRLTIQTLSDDQARELAPSLRSAVGHADTARLLEDRLGVPVATNRESVQLGAGDTVLVAQMRGPRLPEGATKLPPEARIEWLLVRVGVDAPTPPASTEVRPLEPAARATPVRPAHPG